MATHEETAAEDRRQVEVKKTKRLVKGFFSVPRSLIWQRKQKIISTSEYLLMNILLHLENQFVKAKSQASKRGKWFFCSNKDICSYGLISELTFVKARTKLKGKKFIDYKSGHTTHATEYRILNFEDYVDG